MKRYAILWAALALMFLACPAAPEAKPDSWVIDSLDVRLAASDDNSYFITENYEVTFNERRYGIQRNLPRRSYRDNPVEIRDISADDRHFTAVSDGGNLIVRIGGAKKSKEHYTLSYVYDIGDDGLKDMDELYFNIIGDYDARVNEMTFTIEMPHPFDTSRLNFTLGPKGSADNTYVEWRVDGTVITGRTTRTFQPHEQLAAVLPLPEGYFKAAAGRIHGNGEYPSVSHWILLSISLVASAASALLWYFTGRERVIPTVGYYPPTGITPADAWYIMYDEVRKTDVISLIIHWADKGYLSISDSGEGGADSGQGLLLRKLREMGPEAKPCESELFDAMFRLGWQVSTPAVASDKFYKDLDKAQRGIESFHDSSPSTQVFKIKKLKTLLIGIPSLIAISAILLIGYGGVESSENAMTSLFISFFCWLGVTILGLGFGAFIKLLNRTRSKTTAIIFAVTLLIVFGSIAILLGPLMSIHAALLSVPGALMILCERRTELGLRYLGLLKGFRTFLETAERSQLEKLANENPQYFYNILPYAMALGLTDAWAGKFERIWLNPPDWYNSGKSSGVFKASSFASLLSSVLEQFRRAVEVYRPKRRRRK